MAAVTAHAALAVDRYDAVTYVIFALVHGALYAAAVALVLTRPARSAPVIGLAAILAVAAVLRGMAMTTEPGLTTDAYRYVWDGRLTLAGVSPYLYIPADPLLERFRDPAIWPHINQRDTAYTIYPPVAQLVFAAGAWLDRLVGSGLDGGHNGMKIVMVCFEALTVAALVRWLDATGLPRDRVLIYAWHPLPLWEFASQAHIDAVATALLVAAIAAAVAARRRAAADGLAGAFLAGAVLVKYFPLALVPALWRRWDWRMPAVFAATAVALYLPHLAVAGSRVVGNLFTHLDNEGYKQGWGFHPLWLIRELGVGDMTGSTFALLALAALGVIALGVFASKPREAIRPEQLVLLAAAFVWLTSSHYPWYFGWLVPLLAVFPHPATLLMTLTAAALHLPRPPGGATWNHIYGLVYWLPFAVWIGLAAIHRLGASWRRPS